MRIDEISADNLKQYYRELKEEQVPITNAGAQKCPVFENITTELDGSSQVETCIESEICTTLHITVEARFDLESRSADAFFDLVHSLRGCAPVNRSVEVCESVMGRIKIANRSEDIGDIFTYNTTDCYSEECNDTDVCNYSRAQVIAVSWVLLGLVLWKANVG